jgi:hypothetical protein
MNMIEWFMAHPEMLQHLPPDKLQKLHELVKAELARVRSSPMPQSVVQDLVACVGDELMSQIVKDQRHGVSQPGWLKPEESFGPVKRNTGGWQPFQPISLRCRAY